MWVDLIELDFLQRALCAVLLASVACGIVGSYIVVRRIVFISGGISHTAFGGVGLGLLLGWNPLLGAMIFAVAAALVISWISIKFKERIDTLIGILWATGMSLGILFINLKHGYATNPTSYLFGSITGVTSEDLIITLILDVFIVLTVLLFFSELHAVSFDEEYATSIGLSVGFYNTLMLIMIAFTVVVMIQLVGIILVIALLSFPPAIASMFTRSLKKMMILAVLLSIFFTVGGLWISYDIGALTTAKIPTAPTIIIFAALCYVVSTVIVSFRNRRTINQMTLKE